MYSLAELQAFSMVAKRGNFRRAAAELNISASTLSQQINHLEKQLGIRLINRTTRSVSLSEAGIAFLRKVEPALAEIAQAYESVNAFREKPSGQLRINASAAAARSVLLPYVQKFLRQYPQVQVEVVSESRLIDIVKEGFDFGVRGAELVAKDMVAIPLGPPQLSFAVVGSPSYLKKNGVPTHPNDLLRHQCIRYRVGTGSIYQWEFARRGQDLKIDVPGALTVDDDTVSLSAALLGLGLAYQSEWSVARSIKQGRLVRCLEPWTPSYPALSLYYSSARHKSAAAAAFIQVVKESEIPDAGSL